MSSTQASGGRSVRLAIVGFGRVGRATLELALTRPWIDVVAVMARRGERAGERADLTVADAPEHLRIRTDVAAAQLINGIPVAMRAGPGLYSPGQLPPSAPWLADEPPPAVGSRTIGTTR